MAEFVNTADVVGDDELTDSIITRTIQEYRDNRISRIGHFTFCECVELTVVCSPSAISIYSYACRGCISLRLVDLYLASAIAMYAFSGCSALIALVLRKSDATATLSQSTALDGTPIASGTGYIYVPSAMIDSYKAATNWSTYAAQFRALEDYTVDGTVDGELDESKI